MSDRNEALLVLRLERIVWLLQALRCGPVASGAYAARYGLPKHMQARDLTFARAAGFTLATAAESA